MFSVFCLYGVMRTVSFDPFWSSNGMFPFLTCTESLMITANFDECRKTVAVKTCCVIRIYVLRPHGCSSVRGHVAVEAVKQGNPIIHFSNAGSSRRN
jgi:hypothetical protein